MEDARAADAASRPVKDVLRCTVPPEARRRRRRAASARPSPAARDPRGADARGPAHRVAARALSGGGRRPATAGAVRHVARDGDRTPRSGARPPWTASTGAGSHRRSSGSCGSAPKTCSSRVTASAGRMPGRALRARCLWSCSCEVARYGPLRDARRDPPAVRLVRDRRSRAYLSGQIVSVLGDTAPEGISRRDAVVAAAGRMRDVDHDAVLVEGCPCPGGGGWPPGRVPSYHLSR